MTKYENWSKCEVANVVKEWLVEEGLPVQDFEDENTDINYATKQGGVKINIGFRRQGRRKNKQKSYKILLILLKNCQVIDLTIQWQILPKHLVK